MPNNRTLRCALALVIWTAGCTGAAPQGSPASLPPPENSPTPPSVEPRLPIADGGADTVTPQSPQPADTAPEPAARVTYFPWTPPGAPGESYAMEAPEDQHRIYTTRGVNRGGAYPVVVAFHGQPSREKSPHEYSFFDKFPSLVDAMVEAGEIQPVILVVPVFRFRGVNWPDFDPRAFRRVVEEKLTDLGVTGTDWFAFGHSGAAGCGGGGLNEAQALGPKAVGFFDTCLGPSWITAVQNLRRNKIRTVNIHSVETAGFRPRHRPEYDDTFDFGQAYRKISLSPVVPCSSPFDDRPLRTVPGGFACAGDAEGTVSALVIDTGKGSEAHTLVIPSAIRYFLREVCELAPGS